MATPPNNEQTLQDIDAMLAASKGNRVVASQAVVAPADQRCGLIAIVGKPNVGKSTLLNALVGQKISITSRKAQTTRHRITGMHTQGASQYVFVDTPGFQTIHGNALNKSLNKAVQGAVGDVDVVFLVVEAGSFTPADEKVLSLLAPGIPTILVANKLDTMKNRPEIMQWLQSMQERHPFAEIVPMSAKNDKDVQRLLGIAEKYLPEQAWMYAADELTDRSEKFMAAEMVREKLFRLTGDELPYTSTVVINKFEEHFVATGEFAIEAATFPELVLQINQNEPSEAFARQFAAQAQNFLNAATTFRQAIA